jgi:pimeloyl-ACP methyl ester carboxylesterase
VIGLGYSAAVVVAWRIQRQIVWPMSAEERVDRPAPPGAEVITVGGADTPVEGWYFAAPNASTRNPSPAVVFFHGNNEVMDHCLEYAETYPAWGSGLLLVEYRGYGASGGSPTRDGIRADMVAFVDRLASRPEVDAARIVYHGRSIGGAVAADLALERPPAALILVSTFTSLEVMFWRYGVPGFVVADRYRTEDALRSLDLPTLIIHGRRDNIIPVADGRELGRSGDRTRYVELDSNHDIPPDWETFADLLSDFLLETVGTP